MFGQPEQSRSKWEMPNEGDIVRLRTATGLARLRREYELAEGALAKLFYRGGALGEEKLFVVEKRRCDIDEIPRLTLKHYAPVPSITVAGQTYRTDGQSIAIQPPAEFFEVVTRASPTKQENTA